MKRLTDLQLCTFVCVCLCFWCIRQAVGAPVSRNEFFIVHTNSRMFAPPGLEVEARCNTLQHATTCFNTLQHTATHCNTTHVHIHTHTYSEQLQHTTWNCNTLQHAATRCTYKYTHTRTVNNIYTHTHLELTSLHAAVVPSLNNSEYLHYSWDFLLPEISCSF